MTAVQAFVYGLLLGLLLLYYAIKDSPTRLGKPYPVIKDTVMPGLLENITKREVHIETI